MRDTWLVMECSPADERAPHVARIESVGRRLPETRLGTADLMATTRHRTGIDLERLTGIRERRVSAGREDSLGLATAAARDCLEHSRHRPEDLQTVVSCSITKYRDGLVQWLEPTTSLAVASAIGATNAVTFDVANACAGMLTGVFVVADRIRRGEINCGMVVSGEYISQLGRNAARHVRNILSRELASLTLGDAGAAVILERVPEGCAGISVAAFTTVARHSRLCLAGPARHDEGARMFTQSQAIQRAAIVDTPVLLEEVLDVSGISLADVDHVIPHQTSTRAIHKGMREVCAALGGEPSHPAVVTVDRYGNTASTTHFVALVEELEAGRVTPGERVALIALASGLEIGVVMFTADEDWRAGMGTRARSFRRRRVAKKGPGERAELADRAASAAISRAGIHPCEVDLLVNVGLYHDNNLGEPALAALIQDDVHINPEDPHPGGHGSFSFDVANGSCGVLTALQIADGFLRAGAIDLALVVASDADPGRRMAHDFPFSATGAAAVCRWSTGDDGLIGFRWEHAPGEYELFRARVAFEGRRNRLRVEQHPDFGTTAAAWAAKAATSLLADAGLRTSDVDLVVANPLTEPFLDGLSAHLGVERRRVVDVEGAETVHTAGLLVALAAADDQGRLAECKHVLLVSAGAGIVVGAALLVP